jgi:hypothetical protein
LCGQGRQNQIIDADKLGFVSTNKLIEFNSISKGKPGAGNSRQDELYQ